MPDMGMYQPTPSRPTTNYLDIPIPSSGSPEDFDSGPSEAELEGAINNILSSADLNSVTKREIRRQLEDQYGVDLGPRKALINSIIDRLLLGQA